MSDSEPTNEGDPGEAPARPADAEEPPRAAEAPAHEGGVSRVVVPPPHDPMRILRWLAALGVAALLLGRFVAPALPGTLIGMPRAVRAFEVVGGALSQMFAIGTIVGVAVALLATTSTSVPLWIRIYGLAGGAFSALVVIVGAAGLDRAVEGPAVLAAFAAGVFALIAAAGSWRTRVTRLPAASLGLVGGATVIRAGFGLLTLNGQKLVSPAALAPIGRVTATLATLLIGLAMALVLAYVGVSARAEPEPGAPARKSLWSPATLAAVVVAVLLTRWALLGASPEASPMSVLVKRAADRFLVQPEPYLRAPIRLFLGFLTPLGAVAVLFVRRVPTLSAAVCLALIAADVTGAPLGAITLILASLGVLLVARSGHVLWSTLVAKAASAPVSR